MGKTKVLEPWSEAPEFARGFWIGDCEGCGRPVCRNKPALDYPELRRWFAPGANPDDDLDRAICKSCHRRKARIPVEPRRLRGREMVLLRLMVGACPLCGWAEDGRNKHRCA